MKREDLLPRCGLPRAFAARRVRVWATCLWSVVADLYRAGEVDASIRLARFLLAEAPR